MTEEHTSSDFKSILESIINLQNDSIEMVFNRYQLLKVLNDAFTNFYYEETQIQSMICDLNCQMKSSEESKVAHYEEKSEDLNEQKTKLDRESNITKYSKQNHEIIEYVDRKIKSMTNKRHEIELREKERPIHEKVFGALYERRIGKKEILSGYVTEKIWLSPSLKYLSPLEVFYHPLFCYRFKPAPFCTRLIPIDLSNLKLTYFLLRLGWTCFISDLVGTEGCDDRNTTRGDTRTLAVAEELIK